MSAAIQLVNKSIINTEKISSRLELASSLVNEQKLRRAIDYIHELEAEVRNLHAELDRAERAVSHRESLLRNATMREQELRAVLVKGAF